MRKIPHNLQFSSLFRLVDCVSSLGDNVVRTGVRTDKPAALQLCILQGCAGAESLTFTVEPGKNSIVDRKLGQRIGRWPSLQPTLASQPIWAVLSLWIVWVEWVGVIYHQEGMDWYTTVMMSVCLSGCTIIRNLCYTLSGQCWASVVDAGPTLTQRWNASCLLGIRSGLDALLSRNTSLRCRAEMNITGSPYVWCSIWDAPAGWYLKKKI